MSHPQSQLFSMILPVFFMAGMAGLHSGLFQEFDTLNDATLQKIVGENITASNKCHWRCHRPTCGFESYPCVVAPPNAPLGCTAGEQRPKYPTSATCKDAAEGDECVRELISVPYNICKLTGDKNTAECGPGGERCNLEMYIEWSTPDPCGCHTSTDVAVEVSPPSDQCKSDPPGSDKSYNCR
jgi:hypothetical protein